MESDHLQILHSAYKSIIHVADGKTILDCALTFKWYDSFACICAKKSNLLIHRWKAQSLFHQITVII